MRREQQRRERELAGCTFAPKLTHKAEALRRPGSAVDRLYNPAAVRERNAKERKYVVPAAHPTASRTLRARAVCVRRCTRLLRTPRAACLCVCRRIH